MKGRAIRMVSLLGLLVAPAAWGKKMKAEDTLTEVDPKQVHATEGRLVPLPGGRMAIEDPKVRAVVTSREPSRLRTLMSHESAPEQHQVAELRFTYLGPTREQKPLQSGALRQQIGLKLRAQDGCNVVYVMWRIAPKAGLVVSVKHNPEMHHSGDCGNGGYQSVMPRTQGAVPELKPGNTHALRAELRGAELKVQVDGREAWEGTLPAEALTFDGPVGLRSDNGRFQVELRSQP